MRELLTKKASRVNSYQVVEMVGEDYELYKELIGLILENVSPISEKAAWAMNHCFENEVGFFEDYFSEMTQVFAETNYSDSIKRNIVRVFQFIDIPEQFQASIINSCFALVTNKKSAIAVKAFSLGVLEKMVKLYPELKNELVVVIEDLLPKASSGLKNRGQHILRRLS
jgi:hypothetical protein